VRSLWVNMDKGGVYLDAMGKVLVLQPMFRPEAEVEGVYHKQILSHELWPCLVQKVKVCIARMQDVNHDVWA
jgi:hypothetical protein